MTDSSNFDDLHPDFSGTDRWYRESLKPVLATREKERQEAVRLFMFSVIGLFVILALVTIYSYTRYNAAPHILVVMLIVIGGSGLIWLPLGRFKNEIEKLYLPKVASHLGLEYSAIVAEPYGLETCQRLKILPTYEDDKFSHLIKGQRDNRDFLFYEAELTEMQGTGKNRRRVTKFHGQILRLHYPNSFTGETVIRRDKGMLNKWTRPTKAMKQVGMASPKFEKAYEVWSTDQVEARTMLDPIVLERFIELDRLYKGKGAQIAFTGEDIYITISTGNRLKFGSIFKPLAAPERTRQVLTEIAAIYDLLDVVQKKLDGTISGAFGIKDVRPS